MIATTLAVALLASLPIGAVRAMSWLLRAQEPARVAVAVPAGTATHVHVWRWQLRWREEDRNTFEQGESCVCGLWRPLPEA